MEMKKIQFYRHLALEVESGNQYTFYNWSHIDIFVYFSHHFITIPPVCWINAAHQNGVKILGNSIFVVVLFISLPSPSNITLVVYYPSKASFDVALIHPFL